MTRYHRDSYKRGVKDIYKMASKSTALPMLFIAIIAVMDAHDFKSIPYKGVIAVALLFISVVDVLLKQEDYFKLSVDRIEPENYLGTVNTSVEFSDITYIVIVGATLSVDGEGGRHGRRIKNGAFSKFVYYPYALIYAEGFQPVVYVVGEDRSFYGDYKFGFVIKRENIEVLEQLVQQTKCPIILGKEIIPHNEQALAILLEDPRVISRVEQQ